MGKKLVIEIPDRMYELLHDHNAVLDWIDGTHIIECVMRGKPLSEIVESIKAEIEALDKDDVCAKEQGYHIEVLEIIDRKVNEVKGDKNDRIV